MKKLGDTLSSKKSAEQLDKIADQIHETPQPENEGEKPYKLSLELPTWLVKKMNCLLYTSPSPRDGLLSRMPSSA